MSASIWEGGYYELSVEYEAGTNSSQLLRILAQLPNFQGFWQERTFEKREVAMNAPQIYSKIVVQNAQLPCVISVNDIEQHGCWLDIAIPQGALMEQFDYRYPLDVANNSWIASVRDTLLAIATQMYEQNPFLLATIGEEVSGYTTSQDITKEQLAHFTYMLPRAMAKKLGLQTNENVIVKIGK